MVKNNLRELRLTHDMSLRDLSEKLDLNYSTLSLLENGKRNFNAKTIEKITKYFNVSADYLLAKTEVKDITSHNDVKIAFYNQQGIVTLEQQKEIENFIAFVKERDKHDK